MVGEKITCFQTKRTKHDIVSEFYDLEDDSFFYGIHKRKGTKGDCIEDTCSELSEHSRIYEVWNEDELAAYFVKYVHDGHLVLEGFHVKKGFRNRQFLTEFSNVIRSKFDEDFYTGIYWKNEPAIRFLEKMGFKHYRTMEIKGKLFFILKCKSICL